MKKILTIISLCLVATASINTSACTFSNYKKKQVVDEIEKVVNVAGVALRSYIVKFNNNINANYSNTKLDNTKTNTLDLNKYLDNTDFIDFKSDILGTRDSNNIFDNSAHNLDKWLAATKDNKGVTPKNGIGNIASDIKLVQPFLPLDSGLVDNLESLLSGLSPSSFSSINSDPTYNFMIQRKNDWYGSDIFDKLKSAFTPIKNNTLNYQSALDIAIFNIYHCVFKLSNDQNNYNQLNAIYPVNSKTQTANDYYSYTNLDQKTINSIEKALPGYAKSCFIDLFKMNLKDILSNLDNVFPVIQSISILINYFFQFFTDNNYPLIIKDGNHLFSNTLTNLQYKNHILDKKYVSGIQISTVFKTIDSLLNNNTELVFQKILSIFFDTNNSALSNDTTTKYYPVNNFILNLINGLIYNFVPSAKQYCFNSLINGIVNQLFQALSQDGDINKSLDVLKPFFSSLKNQIDDIETYLSKNGNKSYSLLWSGKLLPKLIDFAVKVAGKPTFKIPDFIKNGNIASIIDYELKHVILFNVLPLSSVLDTLKLNLKNIISKFSKSSDLFISNEYWNEFNNIATAHDAVYQKFIDKAWNGSGWISDIIPSNITKAEMKNRSIISYVLYDMSSNELGGVRSAGELLGYNSSSKLFNKNSVLDNISKITNNNSFLSIFEYLTFSLSGISDNIDKNNALKYDSKILTNKNWHISRINTNYQDKINFWLEYKNPNNNKIVNYNIFLKLESIGNYKYYRIINII